jgi:hypothetical protein
MHDNAAARFYRQLKKNDELLAEVMDELRQFNALMHGRESTPFACRLKVRVVCSLMEARLSHMKVAALTVAMEPEKVFTPEDRLALQDQRKVKGTSKGATKLVALRLTMKENVKLALRAFATATGCTYIVNFGDTGGANFLRAMEIRDRVIHPKRIEDWKTTVEDVAVVDAAWEWLARHMLDLSTRSSAALKQKYSP